MLYEISYETNGHSGTKMIRSQSDAEALDLFREGWEEFGDAAPLAPWISARWSCE